MTFVGESARLGGNSLRRSKAPICIMTVGRAFAAATLNVTKRLRFKRRDKRVRKRDWLLLAIADRMQPIQVQKTLFKFAEESGVPKRERYRFVPYDWGPCSFEIYDDLGELREAGLLESVPSGRGWNSYKLTDEGLIEAEKIRAQADEVHVDKIDEIRGWVTSRGFGKLLKDIYDEYPDYAEKSLFTR